MVIAVIIVLGIVLSSVFVVLYYSSGAICSDYWATDMTFQSAEKTNENKVVFVLPDVHGYPDFYVAFTDAAFAVWVNGTQLHTNDLHLNCSSSSEWVFLIDDYVQVSNGIGQRGAAAFNMDNNSYILTFKDSNGNGRMDHGDLLSVESTKRFPANTTISITMYVDIDGTWGIGRVRGSCVTS